MVDFSGTNADVKSYGVPVVPTMNVEEKAKPQVTPVKDSSDAGKTALDEKALHGNTAEAQKKQKQLTEEEINRLAKEIQDRLDFIGGNLALGLGTDKETSSIIARITEKKTGEVVRQIPSEELLELEQKLKDLTGMLFDERA
jgi:flagellar protein FlaG